MPPLGPSSWEKLFFPFGIFLTELLSCIDFLAATSFELAKFLQLGKPSRLSFYDMDNDTHNLDRQNINI